MTQEDIQVQPEEFQSVDIQTKEEPAAVASENQTTPQEPELHKAEPEHNHSVGLHRFAQIMSDVFSPILIPTYCMILAMWITPLNVLPERTRVNAVIGIAFITAIMPALILFTLIRMRRVSDTSVSNRKERTVPYIATIICYALAAFYLQFIHAPEWLVLFYVGAGLATLIATVITLWWKISAHAIGMGGMIGMLLWLTYNSISSGMSAMVWLSVSIVLAGLIGTTRIILKRHTPAQVYMGAVVGIVAVVGTMCVAALILW
jgi:membrane-associated phospholipid phosphatase